MDIKEYDLRTDVGQLKLAAEDIYDYNQKKNSFANDDDTKNTELLQTKFNVELIDKVDNLDTGFGAYALEDGNGDIVITFVGTQPDQRNSNGGIFDSPDLVEDIQIGTNNMLNTFFPVEQYDQGNEFYHKIKADNPNAKITLIGHSLGGGIANTVALRNQADDVNVLALNPAPVLNSDVIKYGDGSQLKNTQNIVNENDPLYNAILGADFVLPGTIYEINNGAGHSFKRRNIDFDGNGNFHFEKYKRSNDSGLDRMPAFLELVTNTGSFYKGLTGKDATFKDAILVAIGTKVISPLLFTLTTISDFNAIRTYVERQFSVAKGKLIRFGAEVVWEFSKGVDEAIDWINSTLARAEEWLNEVLVDVFKQSVDFLATCVSVYLLRWEILSIVREVAFSVWDDIMDVFSGDFVIDTNIEAIVGNHIRSHKYSLLAVFMNDGKKGIDRSLLTEITKDVKNLKDELIELNEDVQSAVVSMVVKDQELEMVKYT
ncbi:lipase family protein [Priestia taiwanensis]|uniref:Lipase n=1 Tax=Priestia taiwanensis TaxID=1347902 RepID=A0A917EM71_9BACI|nr:lipase [Priestia taiwanensis]MBM7361576.1 hypothetical protein [Priestia taiwanensis]GGE55272.1 lipase [Priestia taiwanensis]